jgi:hypothetical protein
MKLSGKILVPNMHKTLVQSPALQKPHTKNQITMKTSQKHKKERLWKQSRLKG